MRLNDIEDKTRHTGFQALLPALAACVIAFLLLPQAAAQSPRVPYVDHRKQEPGYSGPGREEADPKGLTEVRIGYFGPSDPNHPDGGPAWQGACLALEEANRQGGYNGVPFRFVPAWSENPWGTGVAQVARMAYQDEVWAIIGSIDGASTHLAEQVVAKARLALISPVSSDSTVNMTNVAWMFSAVPGNEILARTMANALPSEGAKPFIVLSGTDHDSRVLTAEVRSFLAGKGLSPQFQIDFTANAPDSGGIAQRICGSGAAAVVLIAGASDSSLIVRGLRGCGFEGTIVGGPAMGRRIFLEKTGEAAEGVLFPLLFDDSATEAETFRTAFSNRFNSLPDYAAACTYDSARLLFAAIRNAGLNRARICDALRAESPWAGASGTIEWSPAGANPRPVPLGTIRSGKLCKSKTATGVKEVILDGRFRRGRTAARTIRSASSNCDSDGRSFATFGTRLDRHGDVFVLEAEKRRLLSCHNPVRALNSSIRASIPSVWFWMAVQ